MGSLTPLCSRALRRRSLNLAHDDRQVRERLENASHAAAAAGMKTLEHQRLADMRLGHDELVNIEIMVVLSVGDRRFQALAYLTRHALAREFEVCKRGCHLLAADELGEQVELL